MRIHIIQAQRHRAHTFRDISPQVPSHPGGELVCVTECLSIATAIYI